MDLLFVMILYGIITGIAWMVVCMVFDVDD